MLCKISCSSPCGAVILLRAMIIGLRQYARTPRLRGTSMYISKRNILKLAFGFVVSAIAIPPLVAVPAPADGPQFSVSFSRNRSAQPLDGRIFVLLSTDPSQEPRMQIDLSVKTQILFGVDVDGLAPGQPVVVTSDNAVGYPFRHLRDLPPGEYYV